MKKIIAILMSLVMVLAFAACSKDPVNEEPGTEAETVADEVVTEEASEEAVAGDTVAQTLAAEFEALAATEADAQAIADKLAASAVVSAIGPATMPVEEGFLTGFDNAEIKGFEAGVMFAPMIGTIPFVGYVFVLEDGADVEAFKTTLSESANMRWNICTEAEEKVVESVGNTVFFLMCPKSLEA